MFFYMTGLRTALELLRKNISVILRSSQTPLHPSTCSMGAGGLWMPYKCNDPMIDKWSLETLDELLHNSTYTKDYPVEIVPTLYLTSSHRGPSIDDYVSTDSINTNKNSLPEWTKDTRLSFQHLTIEMLWWQNQIFNLRIPSEKVLLEAGYTHAWLFHPPIVDPPRMLKLMMEEIQNHPLMDENSIDMDTTYQSLPAMVNDAKDLGCDAVVNCTGLGAAKLCGDSTLFGGRGALLHYDRSCERVNNCNIDGRTLEQDTCILTEEGDWGTSTEPCYLIPRGNVLVVGGSYQERDEGKVIGDDERKRLRGNAWKMGINTEIADTVNEWIGWRPCRPNVRVEVDSTSKDSAIRVVHSYGVGGSGWTVFSGVAKETVRLLQQ